VRRALASHVARVAILAAFAAGFSGVPAPLHGATALEIRFTSSLDRTEAALGDRVVATYRAGIAAGWKLELDSLVSPKLEGNVEAGTAFDFAQPLLAQRPGKGAGEADWTMSVPFTSLVTGEIPVPGPRLVLVSPEGTRTPVRPPTLSLKIASRLPSGQKPEDLAPKADRPVRIPPLGPWFWGALFLLVAAVAALVVFRLRRKKAVSDTASPVMPALPPGPELLATLEALAGRLPSDHDDPRVFYSELTHATKRYLERQLRIPVLEWTTFETVRRLRHAGWELPREIAFSELLGAADQVKFGRGAATRDEASRHLARARTLYEHVEKTLATAAAAAAVPAPPATARKTGAAS
jgi:hypothetical protein